MPYVKLDTGILNSTLWVNRDERDIFITALLMAEPYEVTKPTPQLEVSGFNETGFMVPPGWYGLIPAAGPGIVRRALVEQLLGLEALKKLGEPDPESRSQSFEGRRLVRIDGGYLALNYMAYRDKDHSAAERMRRLRQRRKGGDVTRNPVTVTTNERNDPQETPVTLRIADADADAYTKPRKSKPAARSPETPLPQPFVISERVKAWADKNGHTANLQAHLDAFVLKCQKHDYRYRNWDSAFMEAIRDNWAGIGTQRGGNGQKPPGERPSITCSDCGKSTFTWTGGRCDPCFRRYMGLGAPTGREA